MLFDDLLNNPAKWMVESRDEHDIVLTSRIRLARNLTATPFPGWATRQQREETLKLTSGEARQIPVRKALNSQSHNIGCHSFGCPDKI